MAAFALSSTRAVQWPSPRLKAGGLLVLHSAESSDFNGAPQTSKKCYLSARSTRKTRSPSPPRTQSARLSQKIRMAASMPQAGVSIKSFRETSPPKLTQCEEHPSCSSTAPSPGRDAIPFLGQNPSASAPLESARARRGSDEMRKNAQKSAPLHQGGKRSPSPGEVPQEVASRGICDPDHICDTAARIPHAIHLCRNSIQMDQERLVELEAAHASRRREQHAQECQQSRQKAVLWRLRCEERLKANEKKLKEQQLAEEQERKRQAQEAHKETKEKLREKKMSKFRAMLDDDNAFSRRRKTTVDTAMVEAQEKKVAAQSKAQTNEHRRASPKIQKEEALESGAEQTDRGSLASFKRSENLDTLKKKRFINSSSNGDLSRCLTGRISEGLSGLFQGGAARLSVKSGAGKILESAKATGAVFEMPPAFATPDQRIEAARQAKRLKARAERKAEEEEERKEKHDLLTFEEKTMIENAFETCERPGLGLDHDGLRDALKELGIKGHSTEDWSLLLKASKEYLPKRWDMLVEMGEAQKRIGCCLQRFAVDAVPAVKKVLIEYRRLKLTSYCAKEAKRDWEDGTLDINDVAEKMYELWPLDVDAGDPLRVVEKMKRIIKMHVADEGEMLDLATEIEGVAQNIQREASVAQRCLMQEHHIGMRIFSLFRQDLLTMWQLFDKLASESSDDEDEEEHERLLSKRDMVYLCTELNLLPKQVPVLQHLAETARDKIDRGCPCNFEGFLTLLMEIEEVMEPIVEWSCRHLDRIFEQFQIDDEFEVAPYVQLEDLPHIFEKAGMHIKDALVRPALRRVLSDADMEGRGRLMLTTVKSLYNLTKKRISQLQLLGQFAMADDFGFKTWEFREMHAVFGTLDTDDSGSLEIQEVHKAIDLLKLDLKLETHFAVAFEMLDADDSGALDFQEFMNFIKMVRDKEGAFKDAGKTVVSTLKELDRMDLVRLLDCMKKSGDDFDSANIEALMKEACFRLDISKDTPLERAFNVKTLQDLYNHARLLEERRQEELLKLRSSKRDS